MYKDGILTLIPSTSELVSICVPVYNTGSRLSDCFDSLLSQSYLRWEVVVVDDGSSAETKSTLADWKLRLGSQMKLISVSNGGPYDARRLALASSRGDYVLCVDSDDSLASPHTLADLCFCLRSSGSDVVFFNAYDDASPNSVIDYGSSGLVAGDLDLADVRSVIGTSATLNTVWGKIWRRRVLDRADLEPSGRRLLMAEDRLQVVELMCGVRSVYLLDQPLYRYNRRMGSTMASSYSPSYFYDACSTEDYVRSLLDDWHLAIEDWASYFAGHTACVLRAISYNSSLSHDDRMDFYARALQEPSSRSALCNCDYSRLVPWQRRCLSLLRNGEFAALDYLLRPRAVLRKAFRRGLGRA